MKIRIIGAGFYGCHLAKAFLDDGHDVEIHEINSIFSGASGSIPARLHQGFHYPRSRATRMACQEHHHMFMDKYGFLTRGVPVNIYAIAENDSMIDFGQYVDTLQNEVEFITIESPIEFGLDNVEGAILTGERHVLTNKARVYFEHVIGSHVVYGRTIDLIDDPAYDMTIDCTFCANDSAGVDRYEPCIVGMVKGPTDKAITIMDGPFSSLYPWDESAGLNSLSSAKWSPFSKSCKTWAEADFIVRNLSAKKIDEHLSGMSDDISHYFPEFKDDYSIVGHKISIRAMPKSGADSRLVDVVKIGKNAMRVRAGKIDAVIHAEHLLKIKMGLSNEILYNRV